MATIHISEADAARDFAALLARVRAGAEVIIESGTAPVAVLRSDSEEFRPRLLSESIALAKKHAEELGYEPRMDPEFAADLEEIINHRKPWPPQHGSDSRLQCTDCRRTSRGHGVGDSRACAVGARRNCFGALGCGNSILSRFDRELETSLIHVILPPTLWQCIPGAAAAAMQDEVSFFQ